MSLWRLSILSVVVICRLLLFDLHIHVMIIALLNLSHLLRSDNKIKLFINILPLLLAFLFFLLNISCCEVLFKFIHDLDEIIKGYSLSILNFKSLNDLVKFGIVSLKSLKDLFQIVFRDLILIQLVKSLVNWVKRLQFFFIIFQTWLFRLLVNGLSFLFAWSKSISFYFFDHFLFSLSFLCRTCDIWSKLVGLKLCIWFIFKFSNYFRIASPVWRGLFQIFLEIWTTFGNFIRSERTWLWRTFFILLVFLMLHWRRECLLNWALTHYQIQ